MKRLGFILLAAMVILLGTPWSLTPAMGAQKDPYKGYRGIIDRAARKAGVDPNLVAAIIKQSSNFNPKARGARVVGLMGITPATARALGATNPMDPRQNVTVGSIYLASLLNRYGGDVSMAVAAFNIGPAKVDAYHGVPPVKETREFVRRVLAYQQQFARLAGGAGGNYQLTGIEVTRSYPAGWAEQGVGKEAGTRTYGVGERAFSMGYDLTFKSGMQEYNYEGIGHAKADVTLTQIPTVLVKGQTALLAASMKGEWKNQGYGVDRDHTIRLSGDAGAKELSVQAPPSSSADGAIETSNTITVPESAGAELAYTINARISFGEHWCEMAIRLIYQSK